MKIRKEINKRIIGVDKRKAFISQNTLNSIQVPGMTFVGMPGFLFTISGGLL